jgi:hypothetical protein
MTAQKALATLLLSFAVFASTSSNAELCAVLYEHNNYSGASLIVGDANSHNGWIGNWWNDRVSSVSVEPGCHLTVYEHRNYGGANYTLYSSTNYIGNIWNDQISSYRCDC